MSTKITWLAAVFFTLAILVTGCSFPWTKQPAQQSVESDIDVHSCVVSAGYSWCEAKHKCLRPSEEDCTGTSTPEEEANGTIIYLVSGEDEASYCSGSVNDDSEAYRETITKEVVSNVSTENMTLAELVKETMLLAVSGTGMCQTAIEPLDFKIVNGVVRIPPISPHAGISIVMCSCKPRVEVNLLRIPGVTRVVWQ